MFQMRGLVSQYIEFIQINKEKIETTRESGKEKKYAIHGRHKSGQEVGQYTKFTS